jgi:hypothetical protein
LETVRRRGIAVHILLETGFREIRIAGWWLVREIFRGAGKFAL